MELWHNLQFRPLHSTEQSAKFSRHRRSSQRTVQAGRLGSDHPPVGPRKTIRDAFESSPVTARVSSRSRQSDIDRKFLVAGRNAGQS
jgi:hypothetical protein